MEKVPASARHKARHLAVQALYQWQLAGNSAAAIETEFNEDPNNNMAKVDVEYFHELLHQVIAQSASLDQDFSGYLDRKLTELDPVSVSILRMGCYELKHRLDVPYRVVLNESIGLAKTFGPEDSHKFINSILDKAARRLRAAETGARA